MSWHCLRGLVAETVQVRPSTPSPEVVSVQEQFSVFDRGASIAGTPLCMHLSVKVACTSPPVIPVFIQEISSCQFGSLPPVKSALALYTLIICKVVVPTEGSSSVAPSPFKVNVDVNESVQPETE